MPQSCSLQRQLDRYMATLLSVNPGALARASLRSPGNFSPLSLFPEHERQWPGAVNTCPPPIMHSSFQALYIPETFAGRPCIYLRIEIYRGQQPTSPAPPLLPLSLSLSLFSPSEQQAAGGFRFCMYVLFEERSKSSTGTRDCVNFPPPPPPPAASLMKQK